MKYIKYTLVVLLMLFSFYLSDQLILYVESLSPLMQEVEEKKRDDIEPVNAVIDGNTIVPGKNGEKVNVRESYLKMNDFGAFNELFYVYDYIKPEISLYDNLDKVIIKGRDEGNVALIVDNDRFEEYLLTENIKFSKIITDGSEIKDKNIEYINGARTEEEFKTLNVYFKREKINKKICIVGYSSNTYCNMNNYFKVAPTIEFYKSNLAKDKSTIKGGYILFIHDNLSLSECKLIISEINASNLNIIYLSELISE